MTDVDLRSDAALEAYRLERLRALARALGASNAFYAPRLRAAGVDASLGSVAEFTSRMPLTDKSELVLDQREHPPYGTNLTYPLERYTRLHQTSSTSGAAPLRWLDTPEDWSWLLEAWDHVLAGAEVGTSDRALFAFSFGPFIGFWMGFEAAARRGALCLPGGALDSAGRLRLIEANEVSVLCCTPTYALRLAEAGVEEGMNVAGLGVRAVIVAGEPGGSVPSTRSRLESLWGARVYDHYGMTEVGPVTFQCGDEPDAVHVVDSHYLCEVIDPKTEAALDPSSEGLGELVITPLGRAGSPLLRYRTGDLVHAPTREPCACGRLTTRLPGGIVSRADHMEIVRGVNLYPAAIDEVVRRHAAVDEYRVEVSTRDAMTEVTVVIEPRPTCDDVEALSEAVRQSLKSAFPLRIPVRTVGTGELPRFELKAKRWIRI